MSEQPLLVRTPGQRWPDRPVVPKKHKPAVDNETLARVKAALVRLPCQN